MWPRLSHSGFVSLGPSSVLRAPLSVGLLDNLPQACGTGNAMQGARVIGWCGDPRLSDVVRFPPTVLTWAAPLQLLLLLLSPVQDPHHSD